MLHAVSITVTLIMWLLAPKFCGRKFITENTVRILYFSYMIDTQTNLFNIVFLVGGGIAVWSTGAALAILNTEISYFSSQSLTQTPGYHYIATTFAGSLIAVFFLVRW